jgi:uncharacterized protein (TIGR04255 family)
MTDFVSETFENAPLIEVALSVQLQPLQLFTSAHAGEFWQTIKQDFPMSQDQPPLGPIGEFFGSSKNLQIGMPFPLQVGMPGIRNWFVSSDGTYLLQLQRDRFALNWRKTSSQPDYPRYPAIEARFIELFKKFAKFVENSAIGKCEINIHEVTYINQWLFNNDQNFDDGLGSWLQLAPNQVASLEMEAANINVQYLVRNSAFEPQGRLYVNVAPIVGPDGRNGINLELTCRIIPFNMGTPFEFGPLGLAREKIVTTFNEITSDSAQKAWRGK